MRRVRGSHLANKRNEGVICAFKGSFGGRVVWCGKGRADAKQIGEFVNNVCSETKTVVKEEHLGATVTDLI